MSLPLALIHGWGQHGGVWRELLDRLPAHPVRNFELPGHGAAAPAPFALDAIVDAYAVATPGQCAVFGWSLGGMLALRWAQRYPQQVQKLVLFSTTPCFGERPDWPHGAPQAIQTAFAAQVAAAPERALQRFADLLAEGETDVRGVRKALRALLAEKPVPTADILLAGLRFLGETDLRRALVENPPLQPVLLIHGEGDTITACDASRWLAQSLPHARLHVLPHCGHAPMVSHVDEVAAMAAVFLEETV
ncbi:MAG: alpha/beta fold hydrolase [Rhodocyclaceae bacterium]|nr:alpha/beta fold hydrolase [Rhodocyclaceae bacterium]